MMSLAGGAGIKSQDGSGQLEHADPGMNAKKLLSVLKSAAIQSWLKYVCYDRVKTAKVWKTMMLSAFWWGPQVACAMNDQ